MSRFAKVMKAAAVLTAVTFQAPCTTTGGGLSIFPNGILPNPFASFTQTFSSFFGF